MTIAVEQNHGEKSVFHTICESLGIPYRAGEENLVSRAPAAGSAQH